MWGWCGLRRRRGVGLDRPDRPLKLAWTSAFIFRMSQKTPSREAAVSDPVEEVSAPLVGQLHSTFSSVMYVPLYPANSLFMVTKKLLTDFSHLRFRLSFQEFRPGRSSSFLQFVWSLPNLGDKFVFGKGESIHYKAQTSNISTPHKYVILSSHLSSTPVLVCEEVAIEVHPKVQCAMPSSEDLTA